jgi:hypothetical protein
MLLLLTQALAAANECLDDDLDTDVEWVGSGSASIVGGGTCEIEANGEDDMHPVGWRFRVGLNASAFVRIVIVMRINAATRLLLWRSQIG